jgi:putative ABC transport system permease protein
MNEMRRQHPPKICEKILRQLIPESERRALMGDYAELYNDLSDKQGRGIAWLWYWMQILFALVSSIGDSIKWSGIMTGNYMKSAFRNMLRQKSYSFIIIFGLALGMAVNLLILSWVQYEFNFDRFHNKGDHIYRIINEQKHEGIIGSSEVTNLVPMPLASLLEENFPEIVDATVYGYPIIGSGNRIQYHDVVLFDHEVVAVDPSFFRIFDFEFIAGDSYHALDEINSVVITQKTARQFFGDENSMGKIMLFKDQKYPVQVAGIIGDIPETSHLQFDVVLNHNTVLKFWPDYERYTKWNYEIGSIYLEMQREFDQAGLERKINALADVHHPMNESIFSIEPLHRIHLKTKLESSSWEAIVEKKGDLKNILLFSCISLLILLIACINFVNLSTARSAKRSKEVGIRKANGAFRRDIMKQFLTESFMFTFTALIIAGILAFLFLPFLKEMTGKQLSLRLIDIRMFALSVIGMILLTTLSAGYYPSFFMSSVSPVKILKNMLIASPKRFLNLRRMLVSTQFVFTAVLLIVIFVVAFQLHFVQNKNLGFNTSNIISFSGIHPNQSEAFKSEILRDPNILSASACYPPSIGQRGHATLGEISWHGKSEDVKIVPDYIFTDDDFLKTFNLKMAQGRFFSDDYTADQDNILINETLARMMNLENPVGTTYIRGNISGKIIGIIQDFHTSTLKVKIAPTVFLLRRFPFMAVKVNLDQFGSALETIKHVYQMFVPEKPFTYSFFEDRLKRLYAADMKTGKLISAFGLLSLLISCLGLYGLITFIAEQKIKEIGIRKVLGATIRGIVFHLSKEFILLVMFSSLIAIPAGYLISQKWLQSYYYRIDLSWWIFGLIILSLLLITLISVSFQTIKAAKANPVESIRYE